MLPGDHSNNPASPLEPSADPDGEAFDPRHLFYPVFVRKLFRLSVRMWTSRVLHLRMERRSCFQMFQMQTCTPFQGCTTGLSVQMAWARFKVTCIVCHWLKALKTPSSASGTWKPDAIVTVRKLTLLKAIGQGIVVGFPINARALSWSPHLCCLAMHAPAWKHGICLHRFETSLPAQ
jgi:hypothetical protein